MASTRPIWLSPGTEFNGYRISKFIGEGAVGRVYQATKDGSVFALKILKNDHLPASGRSIDDILRFRKETALMARLKHENLVHIFDFGEHQNQLFLVTEFVDGQDLQVRLAKGPLSAAEALSVGTCMASALKELHSNGLIHRDIKPENILFGQDGVIKLIDFGLGGEIEEIQSQKDSDEVVGTFFYSSPEQLGILKRVVDGRSDLYSLGIVLYECLAGRRPFSSEDVGEVIRMHAQTKPETINADEIGCSPVLTAIIDKLLLKDPDDRYQSAMGLIYDLDHLKELESSSKDRLVFKLGQQDLAGGVLYRQPLFGREAECKILKDSFDRLARGEGEFFVIEGEGGVGKSRLTREMLIQARNVNIPVLSGKCSLQEKEKPLASVAQAFDQYCSDLLQANEAQKRIGLQRLEKAAGESAPVVATISEGLQKVLHVKANGEEQSDRQGFLNQSVEFICRLAELNSGLVLLFDDIQWMDEMSSLLLIRLSKVARKKRLYILTTSRNDSASLEAMIKFKEGLGLLFQNITVKPLDELAVTKMVSSFLGDRPVDPKIGSKVFALSNGIPFVITEHLTNLISKGCLQLENEVWTLDETTFRNVAISTNIYDLILTRLNVLPAEIRSVLEIAAIVGFGFQRGFLSRVLKADEHYLAGQLAAATRANVIESSDGIEFNFVHDRVREALISVLPPERIRDINDQIADVLAGEIEDGSMRIYDLAQYCKVGNADRNPWRTFKANFDAGKLAHANFSYKESFDFFCTAEKFLASAHVGEETLLEFWREFGTICVDVGKLDQSFDSFENALKYAKSRLARGEVLYRKGSAYMIPGRFDKSSEILQAAISELGTSYPSTTVGVVWSALVYLIRSYLPIKKIKSDEERARIRLTALCYEVLYMNHFFLAKTLEIAMCIFALFKFGRQLGKSRELVRGYCGMANLFALFGLRRLAMKHLKIANDLAEEMHDREMKLYVRNYAVFTYEFLGDALEAEKRSLAILPEIRLIARFRDLNNALGSQLNQFMYRGYARESVRLINEYLPMQEEYQTYSTIILYKTNLLFQLIILGRAKEANNLMTEILPLANRLGEKVKYSVARVPATQFISMYEQRDFSPDIDQHISRFRSYKFDEYQSKIFYAWICYIRLAQLDRSGTEAERRQRMAQLKSAMFEYNLRTLTPVHRCHLHVAKAGLLRNLGKIKTARKCLDKAWSLALASDSIFGQYMVWTERARLAALEGDRVLCHEQARKAYDLALKNGWQLRAEQTLNDFNLPSAELTMPMDQMRASTGSLKQSVDKRIADALIRVNLASTLMMNVQDQVMAALDEIIKVLAAERGFVFLQDSGSADLSFIGGRNAAGESLDLPVGYSRTVVENVRSSKSDLLVTGSDDMKAIGSESAIVHGLRSIMATPLTLRGEFKGVVYVDSSVAKGLFTQDDFQVLKAIANQITVAFESIRMMNIQAEKKAAEKDLEISAAVQKMLLPKKQMYESNSLNISGFYRPAAQCGGDWWWYKIKNENRAWIFVGDVTGHGAGPAMITSSIASCFELSNRMNDNAELPAIIKETSRTLHNFTEDEFLMSSLGIEVDVKKRILRSWNAASPGFYVQSASGDIELIQEPGHLMGSLDFEITEHVYHLQPGDRIFIPTDGVFEMPIGNNETLGNRRMLKLLKQTRKMAVQDAIQFMAQSFDQIRGSVPQDDDITMVMIEFEPNVVQKSEPTLPA